MKYVKNERRWIPLVILLVLASVVVMTKNVYAEQENQEEMIKPLGDPVAELLPAINSAEKDSKIVSQALQMIQKEDETYEAEYQAGFWVLFLRTAPVVRDRGMTRVLVHTGYGRIKPNDLGSLEKLFGELRVLSNPQLNFRDLAQMSLAILNPTAKVKESFFGDDWVSEVKFEQNRNSAKFSFFAGEDAGRSDMIPIYHYTIQISASYKVKVSVKSKKVKLPSPEEKRKWRERME